MTSKNTKVKLTLAFVQTVDGEVVSEQNTYDATLYRKGESVYVTYTDIENCSIKQKDNIVSVFRHKSGNRLVFESGGTHSSSYTTPAGPMQVIVKTSLVKGKLEEGKTVIKYRLLFNGVQVSENVMNIIIEEI